MFKGIKKLRILDAYILKKFFTSLLIIIAIILPVGIAIDISEKIDKFLRDPNLTTWIIIKDYYQHFIITYANQFLPLTLFLAVVWFTSKLANQTEIIAIHSAQISFNRLLYPYFIGASIIAVFSFMMNHFIVPRSNFQFTKFDRTYLVKKYDDKFLTNLTLQLGKDDYLFMRTFSLDQNRGSDVVFEHYDGIKLKYRFKANSIKFNENDSTYRLNDYSKRYITDKKDKLLKGVSIDTVFNFMPKDLRYEGYLSKEMKSPELYQYVNQSESRGVKNLNAYKVELYKRTSLPFSSFILVLIAVSLSGKKRRGGTGINLAIGIGLAFVYIFFMKISEVLGSVAGTNALLYVWMPNILFGTLAILLYRHAAKQ